MCGLHCYICARRVELYRTGSLRYRIRPCLRSNDLPRPPGGAHGTGRYTNKRTRWKWTWKTHLIVYVIIYIYDICRGTCSSQGVHSPSPCDVFVCSCMQLLVGQSAPFLPSCPWSYHPTPPGSLYPSAPTPMATATSQHSHRAARRKP